MKSKKNEVLVAYVPTVHAGYLKFFRAHAKGTLCILGSEFIQQFKSLVRNLPAAQPDEVMKMVESLGIFSRLMIIHPEPDGFLQALSREPFRIVMPDEDVSHAIAEKYFVGANITFDSSWRLRWDWGATQQKRRPEGERVVSKEELNREFMRAAFKFAKKSPDWWRQIGALLVRDGEVLLSAFNRHVPNEQSCYCYGDPRSNFEQGQHVEMSNAAHAEAGIIAEAARRGIRTEGCDLYTTTFPCPPCAYVCAQSGIGRLFYTEGYSFVAGAEELQAKGVKIIRVEM